jgi:hypothetical protein
VAGKRELVRAVVELRAEQILARKEKRPGWLKSISGLRRWRNAIVHAAESARTHDQRIRVQPFSKQVRLIANNLAIQLNSRPSDTDSLRWILIDSGLYSMDKR